MTSWRDIKKIAVLKLSKKFKGEKEYIDRLRYEFQQISLQGAGDYWADLYDTRKKTETNPNGLILPFLIGLTDKDPIGDFYVLDGSGVSGEVIDITIDNKVVSLPACCKVKTSRGIIYASDLHPNDELLLESVKE